MTCATCVTAGDEDELIFIVIVNEAVDDTVFIWSSLLNEYVSGCFCDDVIKRELQIHFLPKTQTFEASSGFSN